MLSDDLLSRYLNDHLAGATAGVNAFQRTTRSFSGRRWEAELSELTGEVVTDRASLRELMRKVGASQNKPVQVAGRVAEAVGRLKPNGGMFSRTPLTDVVEIEALRSAVASKLNGWQMLRAVAVHDDRIDVTALERLLERAEDQSQRLYQIHMQVVQEMVAGSDG